MGKSRGDVMAAQLTTLQRFFAKVQITEGQCWQWTGASSRGYGHFRLRGKILRAHRFLYETCICPVPIGLELDHVCRNPLCVSLDHLEPVTHAENVRRGQGGQWLKAKTHCPAGHPYDDMNTYHDLTGGRECRICRRQHARRSRARRTLV